jgi:cell division protein FtsL
MNRKEFLHEINNSDIVLKTGKHIPARTLNYWQKVGIAPKPVVKGLGKGKGFTYIYNQSGVDQVIKIVELLQEKRDTKYVLVNLWLLGYSVDTKKFLAIINSIIDNYELWWYRIKEYNDNCDNEIKYVDNRKRHYSKTISSVHRKDYNNFSQWKKMFINVISSKYAFTKSSDLILFLKGINIYNENLNLRDINKEIHEIQKAIHPDNLRKTINDYIIHSPNKSRIDYIFFAPFLEMLLEFPELRNDISNFPVYPFDTVKFVMMIIIISIVQRKIII